MYYLVHLDATGPLTPYMFLRQKTYSILISLSSLVLVSDAEGYFIVHVLLG